MYSLIFAILLLILIEFVVSQQQTVNVLYVDTSLALVDTAAAAQRNCSLRFDPCSSVNQTAAHLIPGMLNIIRFTWLDAQIAYGGLTAEELAIGSSRSKNPVLTSVTWQRVQAINDSQLRESYEHVGADILVRMPWQCQYGVSDSFVQPSGIAVRFEPDPWLSSLNFSMSDSNGTISSVYPPSGSVSQGNVTVLVDFHFNSGVCFAFRPGTATALGSPQQLILADIAMVSLLGFTDFNGQWSAQGAVSPIALQRMYGSTINVDRCVFVNCMMAIGLMPSTPSATAVPYLNVNRVAAYKSWTILRFNEGNTAAVVTIDNLLVSQAVDSRTTTYEAFRFVSIPLLSVVMKNSVIRQTSTSLFTVMAFSGIDSLSFDNVTVEDCSVVSVVSVSQVSQVNIVNSKFQRNTAVQSVVIFQSTPSLLMQMSLFENNTVQSEDTAVSSASGGGALSLEATTASITDTKFIRNTASQDAGAMNVAQQSNVQCQQCDFVGNICFRGVGGAVVVRSSTQRANFNAYQSNFIDNSAISGSGGCVYVSGSGGTFSAAQSVFLGCKAGVSGGAVEVSQAIDVQFESSIFQDCSALEQGGVVMLRNGYVFTDGCSFRSSQAPRGGIVATDSTANGIFLSQSQVSDASATYGGVVSMSSMGILVLDSVKIANSSAQVGAVVLLDRPSAPALWTLLKPHDLVSRSGYDSSSVTNVHPFSRRLIKLLDVSIENTSASHMGDFYATLETENELPLAELNANGSISVSFSPSNNVLPSSPASTLYSGSDPRHIELSSITVLAPNGSASVLKPSGLLELYAGQKFSIQTNLYDVYGTKMRKFPGTMVKIDFISQQRAVLVPSGQSQQFSADGSFIFSDLHITGDVYSSLRIVVSFLVTSSQQTEKVELTVRIIPCPLGYAQPKSGLCSRCTGPRLYSITPGATSCSTCPEFATCDGEVIKSIDGYYLVRSVDNPTTALVSPLDTIGNDSSVPVQLIRCPREYCLAGNMCKGNRDGLLCGSCAPGYSEWSGMCVPCRGSAPNGGLIFAWIVYLLCVFLVQHISSQSPKSAALKILFFFTQLFLLLIGPVSSEMLSWARSIFAFEFVIAAGSTDISCPFNRSSIGLLVTNLAQPLSFIALVMLLFVPSQLVRLIIFFVSRWRKQPSSEQGPSETETPVEAVVVELPEVKSEEPTKPSQQPELQTRTSKPVKSMLRVDKKQFLQKLRKRLYKLLFGTSTWFRSFLQMCILSYSVLCTAAFEWFDCRVIGNRRVLMAATEVMCDSAEYGSLTWLFGLCCAFVCLMPVIFLLVLVMLRLANNKLSSRDAKRFLGSLFVNYKPWCQWFYEPYALSRRLVIVLIVVFVQSPDVMWPLLLLVLLVFLLVQIICRPYLNWSDNIAEEVALSSLIFISSVNLITTSRSDVSQAAQAASSGISLVVFLVTIFVILASFVANNWITGMLVEVLGLKRRAAVLLEKLRLVPLPEKHSKSL